jgi:hypothetical protein
MNRSVMTLALALSLTIGVAACGSDDSDTSPGTSDDVQTPADGSGVDIGGGLVIGTITVKVTHPDAEDVVYEIGCLGDAFPVTPEVAGIAGDVACERLSDQAVIDRLTNGVPEDRVCTEIFGGDDVATITGELDGKAVDATIDRTNGCGIDDWDTLLADVLPAALGVVN